MRPHAVSPRTRRAALAGMVLTTALAAAGASAPASLAVPDVRVATVAATPAVVADVDSAVEASDHPAARQAAVAAAAAAATRAAAQERAVAVRQAAAVRAAALRKAVAVRKAARQAAAVRKAAAARAAARKAAADRASRSFVRTPLTPQAIARALLARRGWSSQYSCLDSLWTKESNWRVTADNPTSSAYGIPQALPGSKMASAGADWRTNPTTQITWGLSYIADRYGSPCGAWSHSRSHNWY